MKCRSCGNDKLKDILQLGDQYLSDFVPIDSPKPEKYPLNLVLCKKCSLLQLKDTTPSTSLYNDHYGYRSGIKQTMNDHLREIVEEAMKRVGEGLMRLGYGTMPYPETAVNVPRGVQVGIAEPADRLYRESALASLDRVFNMVAEDNNLRYSVGRVVRVK